MYSDFFAIAGNIIADRIQLNSKSDFTEIEKAIQEWENQKMMRKQLPVFFLILIQTPFQRKNWIHF